METWILILTLYGRSQYGGVSIEKVDGFRTEKACLSAAKQWLMAVDGAQRMASNAICVKTTET